MAKKVYTLEELSKMVDENREVIEMIANKFAGNITNKGAREPLPLFDDYAKAMKEIRGRSNKLWFSAEGKTTSVGGK